MSQPNPTVEDVIRFVRDRTGTPRDISPETKIDADLGVTGFGGTDLLEAAEERFGVKLATPEDGVRKTFGLGPNEYLFGPEGLDLIGITALLRWLRREPKPVIRDLTIKELHSAIVNAPPLTSKNAA